MHLGSRSLGLRRIVACVSLAVGLGVVAVVLSQCHMVTDTTVGVRMAKAGSTCINKCAMAYNDSIRAESNLHLANVSGCHQDSTCLALEGIRHDAAVNRIQAGRDNCINNCHHQGGGSGG